MVVLAGSLFIAATREWSNDTPFEDSLNQTELSALQPSVLEGFSRIGDPQSNNDLFVADCRDDPRVEYTLNDAYVWADITFDYTGGTDGAGQPVKFTMYADDDKVREVKSPPYGELTLSGDVRGAKTLILEITGAKTGQCTVGYGVLSIR